MRSNYNKMDYSLGKGFEFLGTLSNQNESVDDDERRRVRCGSRTSSKAGKTHIEASTP